MMKITRKHLSAMLKNLRGAVPLTLVAETVTRGGAVKTARINGITGFSYEAAVNRQLDKAGQPAEFIAQAPTWGDGGPILVTHQGEEYLRVYVGATLDVSYLKDGKEVSAEVAKDSARPSHGVKIRKYNIRNIKSITLNNQRYEVF